MTDMRDRLVELLNVDMSGCEGDYAEELADHLLKNGVIVLPCKVGDTVYQVDGVRIYPSTIVEITCTASNVIFVTEKIVFDERAINSSIFLTREEAERALKERGNDHA